MASNDTGLRAEVFVFSPSSVVFSSSQACLILFLSKNCEKMLKFENKYLKMLQLKL